MKGQVVKEVTPGSIAMEAGIEAGDIIITINGEKIVDVFDYRFLITDENLIIELMKEDEIWEIEIEKDQYEDLGIEFENPMLDDAKSCQNKCIFCFIDQLPKDMRKTLYFKDDDSRLSFFMGNYVTLTNMSYDDIKRIIKYRMSPINISVHSTNPELRATMLSNKKAKDIMDKIRYLIDGGITVNCQIVLCREINDGNELDRSINDLSSCFPGVASVSVVPVGLTKFRQGLKELKSFDKESSIKVIEQIKKWQENLLEKYESRLVYGADEFYIMGNIEIPSYEEYEDFPQIENGVGLIAMMKKEFYEYLDEVVKSDVCLENTLVSIATGVSAYGFIRGLAIELEKRFENLKVNVYQIKNNYFGENVTVTGLITGGDIIEQLALKELGSRLLISKSMLKSGEKVFLDDFTIDDLSKKLNIPVVEVENSGKVFIEKILLG